MARFYIHMRDGDVLLDDLEGAEFADLTAAQAETEMAGREMIAELIVRRRPIANKRFEIHDELGRYLKAVPLRSLILL